MYAADDDLTAFMPVDVVGVGGKVVLHWLRHPGAAGNRPFFKHDVEALVEAGAPRRITSLAALNAVDAGEAPAGLIFHTSRCGSTLVSQGLVASGCFDAISEADPVNWLLTCGDLSPETRVRYLRALLTAVTRPRRAPRHPYVVKFTSWNLLFVDVIREAYPHVPCIFVYRDPLETIASQVRAPAPWLASPSLFGTLQRAGRLPDLPAAATLAERCAVVFAACGAAALRTLTDEALWLNYRQLPAALGEGLPAFLGQPLSAEARLRVRRTSRFYAKDPSRTRVFDAEAARAEIEITSAMEAADLAFSRPTYERLEAGRRGTAGLPR